MYIIHSFFFQDMFIQSCLQRTVSNSQIIISIRTFKRFGEYVKSYGYQPKHYQGGTVVFELNKNAYLSLFKVIFLVHRI